MGGFVFPLYENNNIYFVIGIQLDGQKKTYILSFNTYQVQPSFTPQAELVEMLQLILVVNRQGVTYDPDSLSFSTHVRFCPPA